MNTLGWWVIGVSVVTQLTFVWILREDLVRGFKNLGQKGADLQAKLGELKDRMSFGRRRASREYLMIQRDRVLADNAWLELELKRTRAQARWLVAERNHIILENANKSRAEAAANREKDSLVKGILISLFPKDQDYDPAFLTCLDVETVARILLTALKKEEDE